MKMRLDLLRLFDYWRGRLSASESEEIRRELEVSPELEKEFEVDQKLFTELQNLAKQNYEAPGNFTHNVMRTARQMGGEEQRRFSLTRILGYSAAWSAVTALVVVVLTQLPETSQVQSGAPGASIRYSDARVANSVNAILTYIEGTFGALVMLGAGLSALFLIFIRRWKASAAFMVLAIASFSLRSYMGTFFNDQNISDGPRSGGLIVRYNDQRVAKMPSWGNSAPSVPAAPRPGQYAAAPRDYEQSALETREGYGQYEENPRMAVGKEPLSTFSIDVDTASYSNMRRFIMHGQLPPPESVRTEEFINYFDYDLKAEGSAPFAVHYELAPSPYSDGRHLLRISLKGQSTDSNAERGWNLVFLVDVSGSMSDSDKLPLVKQSLKLLAQRMRPADRIAIVTYAGSAGVALPPTSGSERARILGVIDSLQAGGSTNGSSGIETAYRLAEENMIPGSVNRVVLATDGDFNVGIASFEGLMSLIEQKRKSGVTLTTLGFGQGNIQEQTMEQLANRGNGNYYYIDSFREARKVLDQGLAGTMEVIAKDVKIQVEFNPAAVHSYRLIGFDNRRLKKEDFSDDAKDAGEIGSGHAVTALYELTLTGSARVKDNEPDLRYPHNAQQTAAAPSSEFEHELGYLKIRYKAPEGRSSTQMEIPLHRERMMSGQGGMSSDFRFAAAVAGFAELLRQSRYLEGQSFEKVLDLARSALDKDPSGIRSEFIRLVEDAKALQKR